MHLRSVLRLLFHLRPLYPCGVSASNSPGSISYVRRPSLSRCGRSRRASLPRVHAIVHRGASTLPCNTEGESPVRNHLKSLFEVTDLLIWVLGLQGNYLTGFPVFLSRFYPRLEDHPWEPSQPHPSKKGPRELPVVFSRVQLGEFHPHLLGEQHETVHRTPFLFVPGRRLPPFLARGDPSLLPLPHNHRFRG